MNIRIPTNYEQFILVVPVTTQRPEDIKIILKDEKNKNTVFTDRSHVIGDADNNSYVFYIRVPICGKSAILSVYNTRNGNLPTKEDTSFKVGKITKTELIKRMDVIDFNNPVLKTFVTFCTKFCYNAGWLNSGNYRSEEFKHPDNEKSYFFIEYLPYIVSSKDGSVLNTPARICKSSGVMQVSQSKFIEMTVPMRMAIMMHEFSHYYVNEVMDDEVEADLNALTIYLALGYPRIEAYEAFLKTFVGTPSQINVDRYDMLNKFIKDFENQQYLWKE